eukprot:93192_1
MDPQTIELNRAERKIKEFLCSCDDIPTLQQRNDDISSKLFDLEGFTALSTVEYKLSSGANVRYKLALEHQNGRIRFNKPMGNDIYPTCAVLEIKRTVQIDTFDVSLDLDQPSKEAQPSNTVYHTFDVSPDLDQDSPDICLSTVSVSVAPQKEDNALANQAPSFESEPLTHEQDDDVSAEVGNVSDKASDKASPGSHVLSDEASLNAPRSQPFDEEDDDSSADLVHASDNENRNSVFQSKTIDQFATIFVTFDPTAMSEDGIIVEQDRLQLSPNALLRLPYNVFDSRTDVSKTMALIAFIGLENRSVEYKHIIISKNIMSQPDFQKQYRVLFEDINNRVNCFMISKAQCKEAKAMLKDYLNAFIIPALRTTKRLETVGVNGIVNIKNKSFYVNKNIISYLPMDPELYDKAAWSQSFYESGIYYDHTLYKKRVTTENEDEMCGFNTKQIVGPMSRTIFKLFYKYYGKWYLYKDAKIKGIFLSGMFEKERIIKKNGVINSYEHFGPAGIAKSSMFMKSFRLFGIESKQTCVLVSTNSTEAGLRGPKQSNPGLPLLIEDIHRGVHNGSIKREDQIFSLASVDSQCIQSLNAPTPSQQIIHATTNASDLLKPSSWLDRDIMSRYMIEVWREDQLKEKASNDIAIRSMLDEVTKSMTLTFLSIGQMYDAKRVEYYERYFLKIRNTLKDEIDAPWFANHRLITMDSFVAYAMEKLANEYYGSDPSFFIDCYVCGLKDQAQLTKAHVSDKLLYLNADPFTLKDPDFYMCLFYLMIKECGASSKDIHVVYRKKLRYYGASLGFNLDGILNALIVLYGRINTDPSLDDYKELSNAIVNQKQLKKVLLLLHNNDYLCQKHEYLAPNCNPNKFMSSILGKKEQQKKRKSYGIKLRALKNHDELSVWDDLAEKFSINSDGTQCSEPSSDEESIEDKNDSKKGANHATGIDGNDSHVGIEATGNHAFGDNEIPLNSNNSLLHPQFELKQYSFNLDQIVLANVHHNSTSNGDKYKAKIIGRSRNGANMNMYRIHYHGYSARNDRDVFEGNLQTYSEEEDCAILRKNARKKQKINKTTAKPTAY